MAGPVQVRCPLCRELLDAPVESWAEDTHRGVVVVTIDHMPLRKHMAQCTGSADKRRPSTELEQAHKAPTAVPPYVAPGHRYCTGCSLPARLCLAQLVNGKGPCCGLCAETDSHPTAGADTSCAEWAAQHGPQD